MSGVLRFGLCGLGVVAILIGLSNFCLGPDATARFFTNMLALVVAGTERSTVFKAADVDSEFRFYSVFWIAYGALLVRAGRDFAARMSEVPLLLGLFLAGGIGRLLSLYAVGAPNLLFQVLMVVELVLPIALLAVWKIEAERRTTRSGTA